MADSHAVRNLRRRLHSQGDHSTCHQDRCPALATDECTLCGVPSWHPCPVLQKHLDWLRLRGHAETSIYSRRRALARMGTWLAPVPVIDASEDMLMRWRASLDLTNGSIASYVAHAREFYRFAVAEGLREDNPAAGLPVPRLPRRVPRPIGEAELMLAVECAPARIRPWLVLAGWCGLRAQEIALLRRESILDTADPPVLIVTAEAAKGHRIERVIPLSAFVLAELRAARLPSEGYAFRRYDGLAGPNPAYRVSQLICRHLHDCGISATGHQLRHRMLSGAYKATLDLRLVQSLAGHESPVTTAGYAAYASASAVTAVEALAVPVLRAVKGGKAS